MKTESVKGANTLPKWARLPEVAIVVHPNGRLQVKSNIPDLCVFVYDEEPGLMYRKQRYKVYDDKDLKDER